VVCGGVLVSVDVCVLAGSVWFWNLVTRIGFTTKGPERRTVVIVFVKFELNVAGFPFFVPVNVSLTRLTGTMKGAGVACVGAAVVVVVVVHLALGLWAKSLTTPRN